MKMEQKEVDRLKMEWKIMKKTKLHSVLIERKIASPEQLEQNALVWGKLSDSIYLSLDLEILEYIGMFQFSR